MSDRTPERIAHFEIIRLVGRGGMGVLYQARDTIRNREVALKVMSADILEDEEARARFRQEAQLAARQHRNIVKVFEFGEDGDVPFIAMEFLRGRSLADRLASGDPIPLETKLDIVTQVCDGLQCLHEEGIVHRDVKPANIWLLEDGGVKLLDLGVAKHGSLKLTQYGNVVGSVAYIAPEQLSGARVDGRADIFSAGVVLFEILSGQRPFHADSITAVMMKVLHEPPPDIRALVPGLPADVARAVETALQKDPAERYLEAAEFASDLRLARAMAETSLAPLHASTMSTPTAVMASTVVSSRDHAAAMDPMLRSRPNVSVPAEVRTSAEGRRVSPMVWAAAAAGAIAVVGIAAWLMTRSAGGERVELDVRSTPTGAAITVDGAQTGRRTPAVVPLASRPARVGLTLGGYETVDAPIAATTDSRVVLTYTLQRLLQVHSEPPGARIMLEGSDTGLLTPAAVPMRDPRPSFVELRLEAHESVRAAITPQVIESGTLTLKLAALRPGSPPVTRPGSGGTAPVSTSASATTPPGALPGATPPAATPPSELPRQMAVRLSGAYRFEVSGCGTVSAAAETHQLRVTAPCRLHLGAPTYWLDTDYDVVAAEGGQVDYTVPALVKKELRTRNTDCVLYFGDRKLGFPPVVVQIASGVYSVTLKDCPDKKTLPTKAFEIRAEGKPWLNIDDYLQR